MLLFSVRRGSSTLPRRDSGFFCFPATSFAPKQSSSYLYGQTGRVLPAVPDTRLILPNITRAV